MESTSLYKVYEANKAVGSHRPVLVIVADAGDKLERFGEHFVFVDCPNLPFLRDRVSYVAERPGAQDVLKTTPEVFSAESILARQLIFARDNFEHSIQEADRKLYDLIFWSGHCFEFLENGEQCLFALRTLGKYRTEFIEMFDFTQSECLEKLSKTIATLQKVTIKQAPKPLKNRGKSTDGSCET